MERRGGKEGRKKRKKRKKKNRREKRSKYPFMLSRGSDTAGISEKALLQI